MLKGDFAVSEKTGFLIMLIALIVFVLIWILFADTILKWTIENLGISVETCERLQQSPLFGNVECK